MVFCHSSLDRLKQEASPPFVSALSFLCWLECWWDSWIHVAILNPMGEGAWIHDTLEPLSLPLPWSTYLQISFMWKENKLTYCLASIFFFFLDFCKTQPKQILINILVIQWGRKRAYYLVVKLQIPGRTVLVSSLSVIILPTLQIKSACKLVLTNKSQAWHSAPADCVCRTSPKLSLPLKSMPYPK